jgi:alpha-amylase
MERPAPARRRDVAGVGGSPDAEIGSAPSAARPLTLCFGVHDHQPAANFDKVFEEAADGAYLPFLEAASRHPAFRFSLHVSGGLLLWLEEHRRRGVDLIGELVGRGQVELMGGGFYEPILSSVPERDGLGQLDRLSDHLERRFGARPRGAWLAERVWEGRLASVLERAGFRYTVLDDHHFLRAGLAPEALRGYFVTEYLGRALRLFPILKTLRYVIPFKPVEDILGRLRQLHAASGGVPCVTYADDGEKFGLWPGTRGWVYGKGWLEGFLEALERESAWLATVPFAEALERFAPTDRVYLPDASYIEMTEWALPTEARERLGRVRGRLEEADLDEQASPFLAGGSWPGFLAKYPEANLMHKKMLWVSDALEARARTGGAVTPPGRVGDTGSDAAPPAENEALERARGLLYRAQSNCGYWHGVFGGLYLGHLRHAVFRDLLEAESLIAPVAAPGVEHLDFDRDGLEEVWVRTRAANLLVAPDRGGGIPLLELRDARMNLTNVLTRRPEAYHEEIRAAARAAAVPERPVRGAHARAHAATGEAPARGGPVDEGAARAEVAEGRVRPAVEEPETIHGQLSISPELARALVYDPHPRLSALEHLLPAGATLAAFRGSGEARAPAPLERFRLREAAARGAGTRLLLEREGSPAVAKELVLEGDSLRVSWRVRDASASGWFAAEWNLFFFWDKDPGRRYLVDGERGPMLAETLERDGVREAALDDRPMGLVAALRAERPFRLWAFPLETVSRGEKGYETAYQGTCLALLWPLEAAPEQRFSIELAWRRG